MVSLHADAVRFVRRPPLLRTYGSVPLSVPYGLMLPTPIRSDFHMLPMMFRLFFPQLLIRRPTLLKSLNLQIQRSRGITVVYVRSSCRLVVPRRKQNTQVRAPSPRRVDLPFFFFLSFLFVCVYVGDRFDVYTSWASRLYLGMMIFLPIR